MSKILYKDELRMALKIMVVYKMQKNIKPETVFKMIKNLKTVIRSIKTGTFGDSNRKILEKCYNIVFSSENMESANGN